MKRRMLVGALLTLVAGLGLTGTALAGPGGGLGAGSDPPPKCFVMKDGELPTCSSDGDGHWTVTYSNSDGDGGGGGGAGAIVALAVVGVLVGIGVTIWRVSAARNLARSAGMNPNTATAMTLLTKDGLDATYLAANLRGPSSPRSGSPTTAAEPSRSAAERLQELADLHTRGLLTNDEYEKRRQQIVNSI